MEYANRVRANLNNMLARETYESLYGETPDFSEPYNNRVYTGSALEYQEMLTAAVANSNRSNTSVVNQMRPNMAMPSAAGMLAPVTSGRILPRGAAQVASGVGVMPNLR
jgi:hypothetical protein